LKFSGVTILQGVEFPIFLLIFEWALQQCSATALPVIICNIKPFFCTVYCSKNVCWRSREFGCRTVRTFRPQSDGAEVSWVRSVVGPKCLDTFVFLCGEIITSHHMEKTDAGLVASESFNYFKQFYHVSTIASIFKCR